MKKILVLMLALIMTLSLAACGGSPAATPAPSATPAAVERQDNVTPEQAAAIVDIMEKLGVLYNEAAEAATNNGWDQDELTVQELNAVYAIMDSARVGLGELDGYGDTSTEDIDTVVAQYQAILDEMPNIIARVSAPYEK